MLVDSCIIQTYDRNVNRLMKTENKIKNHQLELCVFKKKMMRGCEHDRNFYTERQKKRKWGIGVTFLQLFLFSLPLVNFFMLFMLNIDLWTLLEKNRYVTFETWSKWRLSAGARYARAGLNATLKFDFFFIRIILKSLWTNDKLCHTLAATDLIYSIQNKIANQGRTVLKHI